MTDTDITWNALPAVVTAYLRAHRSRDVAAALRIYRGGGRHRRRSHRPWTGGHRRVVEQRRKRVHVLHHLHRRTVPDAAHVDVVQRLEGDIPGGVADLHYRFTLDGDRICDLVIAP